MIVGAGQAGGWGAKALRDNGYRGPISLIGNESYPPYERPPLSKGILSGEVDTPSTYIWTRDQLEELGIDLRLSVEVERVSCSSKMVSLSSGEAIHYEKLVLATGGAPRALSIPGTDLKNVNMLRDINDAVRIRENINSGKSLVVIGGGWIGLEVAASAKKMGVDVTVIEASDRLCSRAAPSALSDYLIKKHGDNGVEVMLLSNASALTGVDEVSGLKLSNGKTVAAGAVVIGIGITPNTGLAKMAGLEVDDGILVDDFGRTSDRDILAAGDVARHHNPYSGGSVRLESWENAQNQAIAVAEVICGAPRPYNYVPWFWSDQYENNIQVVGFPDDKYQQVVRGSAGSSGSVRFYIENGIVRGAFAIDAGRDIKITKRLIQNSVRVDSNLLSDPESKLQRLIA